MTSRSFFVAIATFFTLSSAYGETPRVIREEIEWLDVWVPGNSNKSLPKVLLIGDSIARGYYGTVEEKLKGKAVVSRLTTSKSLGDVGYFAEVNLILSQTKFDLVHVNNGLHGWGYTEEEYAKALPELIATIRKSAPDAKLIWAMTTPMRVANKLEQIHEKNDRVKARNAIATRLTEKEKIAVNDLFKLVSEKPEWFSRDGVHFNANGNAALGSQVAESILSRMGK